MSRKYFGTDGVRGRVGQTPITPEFAMLLAQAAGRILKQQTTDGEVGVFIGKDTRVSGYMLEAALQAGFLSAGVDVMLGGPLPTPAVAYLTRAQRLSAGVVISASHNPFYDNGIKFFSDKGTKLPDEMELQIEREMDRGFSCVDSARLGKARRLDDAAGRYVEFCKSTFPSDLDLKGFKIYVDCANGAAYHIAPDVYHELGAAVVCGGNTPDGFNINEGVGATHTETLPDRVQKAGCDIGIALDGDADRLIMADRHQVYNGDQLLYLIAKDRLNRGALKGVVGTLMTNFAIEKQFKTLGVPFHRAKVGDRYVLEVMLKESIDLGGEGSGHLIILDKQTTGDGIVSSLQVLSVLARNRSTLESVLSEVALTPQVLINRRYKAGYVWNEDQSLLDAIKTVSKELEGKGRVLVRASGTEPLVRVMVECEDIGEAKKHAQALAELIPLEA
ncbi:phosphoglucosamine mutase [Parasutterella sp.]|uniref:phosphoglucosamine mutase n=1 Tax=Parasutterella sp. TaxID=2049037 RepID=UPI00307A4DBA